MNMWQALQKFALDIPNIFISISVATLAYLIADAFGRDPDAPETVWFGLCAAGFYYHWMGLRELNRDKEAIDAWPDHDAADFLTIENAKRRERARLLAKGTFGLAGLVSIFLPPRPIAVNDALTQVVIILLIVAVVCLDLDAIMDRLSRRRQMALIKLDIEKRRKRRDALEQQFLPVFEAFANEASQKGRELAHDIRGKLGMFVGTIEILKISPRLTPEEQALVIALDTTADEVLEDILELHELVRSLALNMEDTNGPSGSKGPDRTADQPQVPHRHSGYHPGPSGLGEREPLV